jgi:glycosyltransferase involved in cell wall biosynthesis
MPENNLHVLFLPSWYPSPYNPTLGNFVQRHAEAVNTFCTVTVLAIFSDKDLKETELVDSIVNGVRTITVHYLKNNSFSSWKAYRLGWKYIYREFGKPDLIHVHIAYPAGVFALWVKIFYKIPFVVSEHWSAYLPFNRHKLSRIANWMSKRIFRKASCIMPVSQSLQDAINKDFAPSGSFQIVPNVVDTSLFYPADNKPVKNKTQLLHVSTLDEEAKNIFGLFRVISNLADTRKDFELHIINEYPSKVHEDYAGQLGLLNKLVFFHGSMERQQVAEWMRQSDAFVLFSNYESLPVVLIECLSSGLPVIATRVGGIPDHILNDFGILVEPKDETALVNALTHMLDHYKEYDAAGMRAYAIKHFSNDVVGEAFSNIYKQIVSD